MFESILCIKRVEACIPIRSDNDGIGKVTIAVSINDSYISSIQEQE